MADTDTNLFNPSEHNVSEVVEHVNANPEDLVRIVDAERAGKGRVTLIAALDTNLFNPSEHNVSEVVEHVNANPEDLVRIVDAERAGKGRVTLIAALLEEDEQEESDSAEDERQSVVCSACVGTGVGFISGVRAGICLTCDGKGTLDESEMEE